MVSICPTVTAENPHAFRDQIERVTAFARRIHIDISDGSLAPSHHVPVDRVWWPGGVQTDLHVMMKQPFEHMQLYAALKPQLVIVHAEGQGDYKAFAALMHQHGIERGVALLQDTPVDVIIPFLDMIDHVMIFSGNLGHFGGSVDLTLIDKAKRLKQLKPRLEIGWDGGVSADNARALVEGGVEVLNVGGFIQRSQDPAQAYEDLVFATMPDGSGADRR